MVKKFCYIFSVIVCVFLSEAFADGILSVALPAAQKRIMPIGSDDPANNLLLYLTHGFLTRPSSEREPELDLAATYFTNEQADTWTFVIGKEDVLIRQLVNRSAFVGESLLFTRDKLTSKDFWKPSLSSSKSYISSIFTLANIKSISFSESKSNLNQTDKNKTVTFTLKKPDPQFDKSISMIPIIDSKVAGIFEVKYGHGTKISSPGRYSLIENRPNKFLKLIRSRNSPFFKNYESANEIRFYSYETLDSLSQMLTEQKIDAALFQDRKLLRMLGEEITNLRQFDVLIPKRGNLTKAKDLELGWTILSLKEKVSLVSKTLPFVQLSLEPILLEEQDPNEHSETYPNSPSEHTQNPYNFELQPLKNR